MISHGPYFILKHQSGRYLCADVYSRGFKAGEKPTPLETCWKLTTNPFHAGGARNPERLVEFMQEGGWALVSDQFEVVPSACCNCCGSEHASQVRPNIMGVYRCWKHKDRHACAIEGCTRTRTTTDAPRNLNWLCSEHWKIVCPPHSKLRRIYHRFFRIAKKQGVWTMAMDRRFNRFWNALIRRARAAREAPEEFLDEAEIHKMFGWNE